MKKALSILLLSSILFVGCSNEEIINTSYTEKLKTDLTTLAEGPWISDVSNLPYKISYSHSLSKNEDSHVYTIDIGYKETYIPDIQIIVLPDSYIANPTNYNVPNVGYSQRLNLAKEKNLENNDRVNIRLQIELSDVQEYIYVSVIYNKTCDLIKF